MCFGPFYVDYSANGTAQQEVEYQAPIEWCDWNEETKTCSCGPRDLGPHIKGKKDDGTFELCDWDEETKKCSCIRSNDPGPHATKFETRTRFEQFAAIDQIQVFNKAGKTIEGYRIVYELGGDDATTDKINVGEGEETSTKGFSANTPFYIAIKKDKTSIEDLYGWYAKITFKYLDECSAKVFDMKGEQWRVTYQIESDDTVIGNECGKDGDGNSLYPITRTITYKRVDVPGGAKMQNLMSVMSAARNYQETSIIITSRWDYDEPELQLEKRCINDETHKEAMAGVKFNVTLNITGENIYEEKINKVLTFPLETGADGILRIDSKVISQNGLDIRQIMNGKIEAIFEEVEAPAGHLLNKEAVTMTVDIGTAIDDSTKKIVKGKISGRGEGVTEGDKDNSARIIMYNRPGTPIIQLAKVDENGNPITDYVVLFDVTVSYTDVNGKLVHNSANTITGETVNGYLTLAKENFLGLKDSLDLDTYTGELTLDIKEISIRRPDGKVEYSLSSDSLDITLKFENGKITEYGKGKNGEVQAQYMYGDIFGNIYKYATGQISEAGLTDFERNLVNGWIDTQLTKLEEIYKAWDAEGTKYTEMDYDDVLEWLAKYIEEGKQTGAISDTLEEMNEAWISTSKGEIEGQDVIQIAIENKPGVYIPEITPDPDPETFTMTVAGTVFLDSRVTKAEEFSANGLLDSDDDLLAGIEVILHDLDTGKPAVLTKAEKKEGDTGKHPRTNPTMTDAKGYYQFEGVDPFHEYYVEFRYNGMKFENTISTEAKYNSPEWAVSSKGSELRQERTKFNQDHGDINYATKYYDYDEIAGLYNAITKYTLNYIVTNDEYPDWDKVSNAMIESYKSNGEPTDPELPDKLKFINNSKISAYAGYSSTNDMQSKPNKDKGAYPVAGARYLINDDSVNEFNNENVLFGEKFANLIYPGQRQIHLGLVERDVTDLTLRTDILKTIVDVNGKDTTYNYHQGKSSYNQYIYEEDYNHAVKKDEDEKIVNQYSREEIGNGTAFYGENDGIDYYMTYEIKVKNMTGQKTAIKEIVDYYDKNFIYLNEYETSKRVKAQTDEEKEKIPKIKGIRLLNNGVEVTDNEARVNLEKSMYQDTYGRNSVERKIVDAKEYNSLFITFVNDLWLDDSSENNYTIELTFKMDRATYERVSQNMYEHLKTDKEGNRKSNSWLIANYAEINGYYSEGAYIDRNSRPGNFDIIEYDKLMKEYQKVMWELIFEEDDINTEALELKAELQLARINGLMEDDAWKEVITLTNNGYTRQIKGSVWEAIKEGLVEVDENGNVTGEAGEFENSLALQKNNKYALYQDKTDYALEGIKVELVELNEDGTKTVRAETVTGEDGNYAFDKYIAGDYVVRFTYGEKDASGNVVKSKVSTTTYEPKDGEAPDYLPINGQYYQSTKANPNTNREQYWYRDVEVTENTPGEDGTIVKNEVFKDIEVTRFSDAYDDAETRNNQINATIENTVKENYSTSYDYEAAYRVESTEHSDIITSYTSPMELEVEYIRPEVNGVKPNTWYEYEIDGIDFGLTPRLPSKLGIKKYISEVEIVQDDGQPILRAFYDENGKKLEEHIDTVNTDVVKIKNTIKENDYAYPDKLLLASYDNMTLLQNSHLYITYDIIVSNDTEYIKGDSEENNVYDTMKFINSYVEKEGKYEKGDPAVILYYDEDLSQITAYEGDENNSTIITYTEEDNKYRRLEKIGPRENGEEVLGGYDPEAKATIMQTGAEQVIDFPKSTLDIVDEKANWDVWKEVDKEAYMSQYDKYLEDKNESPGKSYMAQEETSILDKINPGERTEPVQIKLSVNLTSGYSGEFEYDNMAEITRIQDDAGKITDLQGYRIGDKEKVTSEVRKIGELDPENPTYYPTLTTSKSPMVVISQGTGLTFQDNVVSNLGIVLVVLIVFAGGLILIKKFVITPKK